MEQYVYLNRTIVPVAKARISPLDRGFLYGDGFFETIRVENGYPLFLEDHLNRLYSSCSSFNIHLEKFSFKFWTNAIEKVVTKNELSGKLAAVKIMVTRGNPAPELGLPETDQPTVVVYARPYTPPSKEAYQEGLNLSVFPHGRHSFIADHKSLNYLFYLAAKEYAKGEGADEAIVLNEDGSVSEGATTNILYVKKNVVCRPASPHYLKGIMQQRVVRLLQAQGVEVIERRTVVDDLLGADEVILTNSLIEVIPVRSIDGEFLSQKGELTGMLFEQDWCEISKGIT